MTSDVERRLAVLEDIRAIETLKWRYLRACDRKQPQVVRDCFVPEAVIDYEGFPRFENRESFVDVYERLGCQPHIVDMHHGQNPIVEMTGPDSARGYFDLYFFQIDTIERRHTQMAVSYDDEFVRRDGRWWIAGTVSRRLSIVVQNISAQGVPSVAIAARNDAPTG